MGGGGEAGKPLFMPDTERLERTNEANRKKSRAPRGAARREKVVRIVNTDAGVNKFAAAREENRRFWAGAARMGIASDVLAKVNQDRRKARLEEFTPRAAKDGKIDVSVLLGRARDVALKRTKAPFPRMSAEGKRRTLEAWREIFFFRAGNVNKF